MDPSSRNGSPLARKRTVLVIEDDDAMAVALRDGFESEGDHVLVGRDGVSGLELARSHATDILILDVMLPRMSGLEVRKRLRRDGNNVPIIMLTARGQEIDRVWACARAPTTT
jgi:DNA-binding response OmpR family regulator